MLLCRVHVVHRGKKGDTISRLAISVTHKPHSTLAASAARQFLNLATTCSSRLRWCCTKGKLRTSTWRRCWATTERWASSVRWSAKREWRCARSTWKTSVASGWRSRLTATKCEGIGSRRWSWILGSKSETRGLIECRWTGGRRRSSKSIGVRSRRSKSK